MEKIKVMSIFGTRPEAIKMAPVIQALEKSEHIENIVCVTAQHREMLDQVLKIFNIKPHYDLDIMTKGQTLTDITTKALIGLENVIKEAKPNIILVHGDTTTTFVGSLAGFYSKVKIGHVEAGLRTNDKYEPFPEEVNRKLTGVLADLHFAPTSLSKKNLLLENVPEDNIFITGNTVIDCLKATVTDDYTFNYDYLNTIDFTKKIITMTAHRRENIGENLENICKAVKRIIDENNDIELIYAVHFNPLVRETVNKILGSNNRIHIIDPIDMKDMHNLLKRSFLVMTDSGGLQEEVPSLHKPVIVLRNVTERPEGIDAGTLKLGGVTEESVYNTAMEIIGDNYIYNKMASAKNPFGDGFASERILDAILYHFGVKSQRVKDFI